MKECSGKPVLPDRFSEPVTGPYGELRFREYTAEEEQEAARVRAAVEAYCAELTLSAEATQDQIARELANYDNAVGRRDVRIKIHDDVCPIESRHEMKHVPGMRIFMGEAANPDDSPFRSDRTSASMAPTPPATPPSTPPRGTRRIPTPKPDFPWALDDKPERPASGSTHKAATKPPSKQITPDATGARSLSARVSVQQAKRVVGKDMWRQLDKCERVKLAAVTAKWMSSPRSAAKTAPGSSACSQPSPPCTPVEVKIGRTIREMQDMRIDKRLKPRAPTVEEGLRLRQDHEHRKLAVTAHGVSRQLSRSHTPPNATPWTTRAAEVW